MADKQPSIEISVAGDKEKRRRRRELLIAGGLFLVVVVLTMIELKYLGSNFYLFLAFFNLNFIFLLIVLLLVVRNGVKLMLERRRNVLGARLRARLVLAFIFLSLVPSALMYVMSIQFVQTSVDYWFKSQIESSMEQALDVGQTAYELTRERLGRRGETVLRMLNVGENSWGGPEMERILDEKYKEYQLIMLGLVGPDLSDKLWKWTPRFAHAWTEMREKVNWERLEEQPEYWSMWWPGAGEDFVVGVLPVRRGVGGPPLGYLVLGDRLGSKLLMKLDHIARGVDEYKKLKNLKKPLKSGLYLIMGLLTLLIIFGAMWFGFRLAKELTEPIQALARGTERVGRGDLTVRLDDTSSDEFGVLVRSFNRMAEDLERSQLELREANVQLEQQNVELEQRGGYIATVLDTIATGVVSLDKEGRIGAVNKAAASMLGVDPAAFMGLRPQDFLMGEQLALFNEAREFMERTPDGQWQRQMDFMVRGQTVKLLMNVVSLPGGEENTRSGQVAVFEDITELAQMQRLAAWREVARRIAHEIKNPLTPIKLSAQRLDRKFSGLVKDPAFGECADLIVRQVERMQQMVAEFSSFAKLPELNLQPGDVAPLLEEVVSLFQHSHSDVQWTLDISGELPKVNFDREALQRGLINILTNAAEALQAAPGNGGAARVQVFAEHDEKLKLVRMRFQDNGPGLNPEERERLFEPYFSSKKGGAGLGLSILKSIITDHQGYVRAHTAKGGGMEMVVELPAA